MSKAKQQGTKSPAAEKPSASSTVHVPGELRRSPVLYTGEIGTFGLGGPIIRGPIKRNGLPPVDRPDIPEATENQYKKLLDAHPNGLHGIHRLEHSVDTAGSEPG